VNRTLNMAIAILMVTCAYEGGSTSTPAPTHSPTRRVFPFTRSCDSAAFGQPNLRHAVRIGPLSLIGTDQRLPRRTFDERHGRYPSIQVLAVISGRDDVTVTVPLSQRDSLFLLYNPVAHGNGWGYRISDADAQVRFDACPGTEPQYNGGFLLTEARCVQLDVDSATTGLLTASIPIGDRASC
jgi:hypothetical protein